MKNIVIAIGIVLSMVVSSIAADYVEKDQFKQWLVTGKPVIIVDIQPAVDFARQHFNGSIETNAYPGKTEEEKKRLDRVLPLAAASHDEIVIVCPRGGGGAKNAYEYLKSRGVAEERLHILEDGINGWPYKELLLRK